LETLAREQISMLGADTSVSTFVNVALEAYPTTIRWDDWLQGCITSLMRTAIKNKSASTTHEEFEKGKDTSVANIIVKALLEVCREMVAEEPAASPESWVLPTPQTDNNSQATSTSTSNPAKVIQPKVTWRPNQEPELELKPDPDPDPVPEQPPKDNLEPESHLESERKEPVDDWATPAKSKKDKKVKKGKKSSKRAAVEAVPVAACELPPELEPELEPAAAAESPMELAPEAHPCEPEPVTEAAVLDTVDEWAAPFTKKLEIEPIAVKEEALGPEEAQVAEERVPEPEPEPEPVAEAAVPETVDEWAAPTKKKKKKAVSIGSWADLVEEPRDIAEEAERAAVTVVTEVEVERDPWSFWGVTRSPNSRQSLS